MAGIQLKNSLAGLHWDLVLFARLDIDFTTSTIDKGKLSLEDTLKAFLLFTLIALGSPVAFANCPDVYEHSRTEQILMCKDIRTVILQKKDGSLDESERFIIAIFNTDSALNLPFKKIRLFPNLNSDLNYEIAVAADDSTILDAEIPNIEARLSANLQMPVAFAKAEKIFVQFHSAGYAKRGNHTRGIFQNETEVLELKDAHTALAEIAALKGKLDSAGEWTSILQAEFPNAYNTDWPALDQCLKSVCTTRVQHTGRWSSDTNLLNSMYFGGMDNFTSEH